jgi:hypothetical protein
MDVYLVPAKGDRHALYCEHAAPPDVGPDGGDSWLGRVRDRFRRALAEGEAERRARRADPSAAAGASTIGSRVRRALTRRLAEAVAEQQLLWHLRRARSARLVHPDDLPPARAIDESRRLLVHDRDRHRRWCIVDGVLTVVATPAALLPGPNLLAYYFLFRGVGHFLAFRGARHALAGVTWQTASSPDLTAIREVLPLGPDARAASIARIAATLGLSHLAGFVEDVSE